MVTIAEVDALNEIRVDVQNAGFPLSPFTDDEKRKWNAGFAELWYNRNGVLRSLYDARAAELYAAARASKKALKDKTFGGFSAANTEIGMSPIRPGHVGFTSDNTISKPNNVWRFDVQAGTASGGTTTATQWIGNTSSGYTVGGAGANTFIVNIGLLELSLAPVCDALSINIGRATLLPIDTHALRTHDIPNAPNVSMIPLPTTFWGPQESVNYQIWSDNGGTCELIPLGYTYALGATLNKVSYNESQRTT